LKENVGENPDDLQYGDDLLDAQKAQSLKLSFDNWDFIKSKTSALQKSSHLPRESICKRHI
jgi:hypothetical protein